MSGPATSVAYEWDTGFPLEEKLAGSIFPHAAIFSDRLTSLSLRTNAVSVANRVNRNPYIGDPEPIELRDSSLREVRKRTDLAAVDGFAEAMTFTAATEVRDAASAEVELLALGVA